MATDQDATHAEQGATAARLRDALDVARHAMERAYAAYGASEGPYNELVRLNAAMDAADKAYDAALDTLIQYHRSVAARDALRDGELALWHPKDMRDLLAAAWARLTAY